MFYKIVPNLCCYRRSWLLFHCKDYDSSRILYLGRRMEGAENCCLSFQSRVWDHITCKEWVFFPVSGQKKLPFLPVFKFFNFFFNFILFFVGWLVWFSSLHFFLYYTLRNRYLKACLFFFLIIFWSWSQSGFISNVPAVNAYQSKLLVNLKIFRCCKTFLKIRMWAWYDEINNFLIF